MPETTEPEQIRIMKRLVELSVDRSQMSAERSYMNAERTLAVWIRTALALMIFGIAVDRFSLLLRQMPASQVHGHLSSNDLSSWGGGALIGLGVLMAVCSGSRFFAFSIAYRRVHQLPPHHGPYLGPVFATLVALFGIALLVILNVFTAR
jgi:putative membrane protein